MWLLNVNEQKYLVAEALLETVNKELDWENPEVIQNSKRERT